MVTTAVVTVAKFWTVIMFHALNAPTIPIVTRGLCVIPTRIPVGYGTATLNAAVGKSAGH